jgi:predicted lipoprotein with Yx(FWY)xxD motif
MRMFVCLLLAGGLAVACEDAATEDQDTTEGGAIPQEQGTTPSPATEEPVALAVHSTAGLGTYVTDGTGRALYLFTADRPNQSACDDACAGAWPPLTSVGTPAVTGGGLRSDLIGTIQRGDGATQVTYNGWPLYHYASDLASGRPMGHDVKEHGGEWYLMSPSGEPVRGTGAPGS